MSFRCDKCDTSPGVGIAPTMVVTKIRLLTPPPGFQIAKELRVCPPCAETFTDVEPEAVGAVQNTALLESMAQAERRNATDERRS